MYLGVSGQYGAHKNFFEHAMHFFARFPRAKWPVGMFGHDAAAAVVDGGRVVAAIEEERFNRQKHTMGVPTLAIEACSKLAGVDPRGLRAGYYTNLRNPLHIERRVEAFKRYLDPQSIDDMLVEYEAAKDSLVDIEAALPGVKYIDHHKAHAASAFYASGFESALTIVLDAASESMSTSAYIGDAEGLRVVEHQHLTSSLGMLYAMVTAFLGFEILEDEYKVMGLAAYADTDAYRDFFDKLFVWEGETSFSMPALIQNGSDGGWLKEHLGAPRAPDQPVEPHHQVVAYSLQKAIERVVMRFLEGYQRKFALRNLCIAGGVGLNCAMNGVIDRSGLFDEIFVQPAAGDAGTALGAALALYHEENPGAPRPRMQDVYLGPSYGEREVLAALAAFEGQVQWHRPADFYADVAARIAKSEVIGWFQGRMEYGPRALGNRSIVANPTRADMKDHVNKLVKRREEFRPFAPSVLAEHADELFFLRSLDQYEHMTIAVRARPEKAIAIPAVVHVDGTARVQVVKKSVNPGYWELIERFRRLTGVPVVLNTSFNVRGEPIVCTPEDALRCFVGTGIDCLAMEGFIVTKKRDAAPSAGA